MNQKIRNYIVNKITRAALFAMLLLAPFASFSQPSSPGSTPAPGGGTPTGGTNPDPVGVPIDGLEYLLVAGLAMVAVKMWGYHKGKKATA